MVYCWLFGQWFNIPLELIAYWPVVQCGIRGQHHHMNMTRDAWMRRMNDWTMSFFPGCSIILNEKSPGFQSGVRWFHIQHSWDLEDSFRSNSKILMQSSQDVTITTIVNKGREWILFRNSCPFTGIPNGLFLGSIFQVNSSRNTLRDKL